MEELENELRRKLKTLSEIIWDGRVRKSSLDQWLNNFNENEFKVNLLYLLTHFVFFSKIQINEMLKSLYRDLYRYPIISKIRHENNNTLDRNLIEDSFTKELSKTRFVSLGGPSESSTHLLYPFGKINSIHKDLLITDNQMEDELKKDKNIENFIFMDDLAGSGTQAKLYLQPKLTELKKNYPDLSYTYMVLICTSGALHALSELKLFKEIKAVYSLDASFKAFNENSRFYADRDYLKHINLNLTKEYSEKYGEPLYEEIWKLEGCDGTKAKSMAKRDRLGFKDGQLLIGFEHNTPSNTLPIIWFNEKSYTWNPIFTRFNKVYKSPV